MTVHRAKTQISLGIHPVWSESPLCAQRVVKDPSFLHADSEDWSDWVDAQADLSLCWAHIPFCLFCHETAHLDKTSGLTVQRSHVTRKPVFGVCDQVRLKPVCYATETS